MVNVRHSAAISLAAARLRPLVRTRFMVRTGDGQCELLSIRQRTNGDLSILIPGGEQHATPDEISEYRFHIRASEDPDGAFIFYDNASRSGRRQKSVLFVQPRRRALLFPVYSVRCADLSGREPPAIHPFDQLVDIADYDPRLSVLVYHLAVSDRGQPLDGLSDFNSLGVDFDIFRITLLWGFMRAPSLGDGGVRGLALPAFLHARMQHGRHAIETRKSLSVAETGIELRHARSILSHDHVCALKRLFAQEHVSPDPRFEQVAHHYALAPLG
jgi:hypothetical protein